VFLRKGAEAQGEIIRGLKGVHILD
jgi:hypothetical protein